MRCPRSVGQIQGSSSLEVSIVEHPLLETSQTIFCPSDFRGLPSFAPLALSCGSNRTRRCQRAPHLPQRLAPHHTGRLDHGYRRQTMAEFYFGLVPRRSWRRDRSPGFGVSVRWRDGFGDWDRCDGPALVSQAASKPWKSTVNIRESAIASYNICIELTHRYLYRPLHAERATPAATGTASDCPGRPSSHRGHQIPDAYVCVRGQPGPLCRLRSTHRFLPDPFSNRRF